MKRVSGKTEHPSQETNNQEIFIGNIEKILLSDI